MIEDSIRKKEMRYGRTDWGMEVKNQVEIKINGRKYYLKGAAEESFLRNVADYIDKKYEEVKGAESYQRMDTEMKKLMLHLNIAGDYYRQKETAEKLLKKEKEYSNDIFELKQALIEKQEEAKKLQQEQAVLKTELEEQKEKQKEQKKQTEQIVKQLEEERKKVNSSEMKIA